MSDAPVASTPGAAGGLAAEALLAVADLHAWYDESHILHGVCFVEHGRVVDLIDNASLERSMDKLHDYLGV